MRFRILLSVLVLFSLSCRKRDISVPSYIHIAAYEFETKAGQGTNRQLFEYVNVFINDNSVGNYSLPATFPVLATGNITVDVRPVIKEFARSHALFNMVEPYLVNVNLKEGEIDTIQPVFKYLSNVKFVFIEDFNDTVTSFQLTQGSLDTFYIKSDLLQSADSSPYLEIPLGAAQNFFQIESEATFEIPRDRRNVYLEFEYQTNFTFTIGLTNLTTTGLERLPSVSPFPSNEWKKGYVQLNDEVFNSRNNVSFKLYFQGLNTQTSNALLRLDNLKIIFRE